MVLWEQVLLFSIGPGNEERVLYLLSRLSLTLEAEASVANSVFKYILTLIR